MDILIALMALASAWFVWRSFRSTPRETASASASTATSSAQREDTVQTAHDSIQSLAADLADFYDDSGSPQDLETQAAFIRLAALAAPR